MGQISDLTTESQERKSRLEKASSVYLQQEDKFTHQIADLNKVINDLRDNEAAVQAKLATAEKVWLH